MNNEIPPGRPVELVPAPRGLWWVILGGCTAVLAPMFGFLVGTILTDNRVDQGAFTPLYLGLFFGFIVGGLGVLAVIYGGWRLYRAGRARGIAEGGPQVTPERSGPSTDDDAVGVTRAE